MIASGTKIIVQPELTAAVTEGGIALPDTMQRKLPQGVVVAVGPEVRDQFANVRIFEQTYRVCWNEYAGTPVTVKGQDYLVLDQDDILLILEAGE